MRKCDYCGRESDDLAEVCCGCSTPLSPLPGSEAPAPDEIPPPLPSGPQLNARRATHILLVYLGAQVFAGFLIGLFAGVARGQGPSAEGAKHSFVMTPALTAWATVLSLIGGAVALLCTSRAWVRDDLADTSSEGAAWVLGSRKLLLQGLALGLLAGLVSLMVVGALATRFNQGKLGPLATMAMTPGIVRVVWFVFALAGAPPIEELLFRGVLYGGYRRSLGPTKAAALITAIFCLLHVTEWIHFLPALFGITTLALLALWMRLRSAAIGPAIATHFGYNAAVALVVALYVATEAK